MKTSKVILASVIVFATIFHTFSQETYQKVLVMHSQAEIDEMLVSAPQQLDFLKKYADEAIEVFESEDPKFLNSVVQLTEIPLRSKTGETITVAEFLEEYNSGNINALKYAFFSKQIDQVFHLVGTNKNILIVSTSKILN